MEVGSKTLLIDEDTCATNFMIRDEKMIELVAPNKEPITPFVKKVESLYNDKGVSSVLVIGGSGDYFAVADSVVMMDSYHCLDVTDRAKEIAKKCNNSISTDGAPFGNLVQRYPIGKVFVTTDKVLVRSKSIISYGNVELDLSGLEQIVSDSQTQAISSILRMIPKLSLNNDMNIKEILSELERKLDSGGLDELSPGILHGGLARPRPVEIAGAINRLRCNKSIIQRK